MRSGPWKLIHARAPVDRRTGEAFELYHLERDPGELENVAAAFPEVVARLQTELERWQQAPALVHEGQTLDPAALDPAEREMLRQLGYLD